MAPPKRGRGRGRGSAPPSVAPPPPQTVQEVEDDSSEPDDAYTDPAPHPEDPYDRAIQQRFASEGAASALYDPDIDPDELTTYCYTALEHASRALREFDSIPALGKFQLDSLLVLLQHKLRPPRASTTTPLIAKGVPSVVLAPSTPLVQMTTGDFAPPATATPMTPGGLTVPPPVTPSQIGSPNLPRFHPATPVGAGVPQCVIHMPPQPGSARLPGRSYASIAVRPTAVPQAAPPAIPLHSKPTISTTTKRVKSCLSQGVKSNKVVLRPAGDNASTRPPAPTVLAATSLETNRMVSASWTLRGDFEVILKNPPSTSDIDRLTVALRTATSGEVSRLGRPTTSSIKFLHVPTSRPDRTGFTNVDALACITAHPKWADVVFYKPPTFVFPKKTGRAVPLSGTIKCEIFDDRAGSRARRLLQTDISFIGTPRRAQPWTTDKPTPQCGVCLRWGHTSHRCVSRVPWCAFCASNHPSAAHDAAAAESDSPLVLKCLNCDGDHSAISRACPFYKARFTPKPLAALETQRLDRVRSHRLVRSRQRANARPTRRLPDPAGTF